MGLENKCCDLLSIANNSILKFGFISLSPSSMTAIKTKNYLAQYLSKSPLTSLLDINSNTYGNSKDLEYPEKNLKTNRIGRLTLTDLKTYYTEYSILYKDRPYIVHRMELRVPEISSCIYV